jgi:hypothetical protein
MSLHLEHVALVPSFHH